MMRQSAVTCLSHHRRGICVLKIDFCTAMAETHSFSTAIRMVEIANRVGQLETNIVTERAARMDAEQHVLTLTAHVQTLTSSNTQTQAESTGLVDAKGAWNDWGAISVVLHRTAAPEPGEGHDELSGGNSCQERRPRARQLVFALTLEERWTSLATVGKVTF